MILSAHELPEAIQWHEGMLLAPQHFQQLASRQEDLLGYHAAALSPFHWGIRHRKIDPIQLVGGSFRVVELEAVMPDGLLVSDADAENGALSLDLRPFKDTLAAVPQLVHLAVPARRASDATQGEWARYRSETGRPVRDQNDEGPEVTIPRLRPRLRLILGDPPEKYVSFPLALVAYREQAFELAPYVPPRLRVPAGSQLGELCEGVARRLRESAVVLAEQVPLELETRTRIHALVAGLPPLEALLGTGSAHPFTLYLALCAVVGQVAALSRNAMPPELPPYDHNQLWRSFEAIQRFILEAVDEGTEQKFARYPFTLRKGAFYLQFLPEWMAEPLVLGVRRREGATEREIVAWMDGCLIGSRSELPSMRARRVLGAAREPAPPDGELQPTRGVSLYAFEPDPEFVRPGEPLLIVNLDDAEGKDRPVEVVLYVKKRSV